MYEYCFYLDWAGWKPEVWAAWAQGILSVLAIFVAAWLARRQARMQTRERLDTIVAMLKMAHQRALLASNIAAEAVGERIVGESPDFDRLRRSLQAIPVHELPDYRLIDVVEKGSLACGYMHDAFDSIIGTIDRMTIDRAQRAQAAARTLEEAFLEAAKVSNSLRSLPWFWNAVTRVRSWLSRDSSIRVIS